MADGSKRMGALSSLIKLDDHHLNAEKSDMARALKILQKDERDKTSADELLHDVEQNMRNCVADDGALSIPELQRWRRYLPVAQQRFRQAEEKRRRSVIAADQTAQAVARRKASMRSVEKLRSRLSSEQRLDAERQEGKEIDTLWLQRWGR
jgi:hypothetical protein